MMTKPGPTERLFAVAYEKYTAIHGWVPEIDYLHAETAAEARNRFCIAYPNRSHNKIVAIGAVLGYNVDEKGENPEV